MHVLKSYSTEKEVPVRDYLHVVLHCIFRHMFVDPTLERELWDLACDIAIENCINELRLKSAAAGREKRQQEYISRLVKKTNLITAEKIYSILKSENVSPEQAGKKREDFFADDHSIWYMTDDEKAAAYGLSQKGDGKDNGDGDGEDGQEGGSAFSMAALESEWAKISERMQVDMETFGKQKGDMPGGMIQNLKEVNREKYDYTAFLKKFASLG